MAKKDKTKFVRNIDVNPITKKQQLLFDAIKKYPLTVAVGLAGTGKTYLPTMLAAKALVKGDIDKIILTRPNVDAGEPLGFLPGTQEEKLRYWLAEPLKILAYALGDSALECDIKNKNVELVPFQKMRGLTLENAFIILDEAQNTTERQMELFTTRIGKNVRVIVDGDATQHDLRAKRTGMTAIINLIKRYGMDVPIIEFTAEDVVRSGLCREFVINWQKYKRQYAI